ncbi:hypothetical protein BH10ACI4_BH10ACI4_30940 [soil metagenome]
MDIQQQQSQTEIIAFCSGKGGTGKSLLCSCLGYALIRGGQRVLLIDGDPATDGLSLFLLGPQGTQQVGTFVDLNTFVGAIESFEATGEAAFEARGIHRRAEGDHGVTYQALISGRGLYGDKAFMGQVVPDLDQPTFRASIQDLFTRLRNSGQYDYILVDTRGGFAFESADICALANSFIVVTEPDVTSFYQDRNLVASIAAAATQLESPSLLRAIIVNKAVDVLPHPGSSYLDTLEVSFRNELVREFGVKYKETYPVPVAIEVLMAYKVQKIPYLSNPDSAFCYATLAAFSDILQIVTSRWSTDQAERWNVIVEEIASAVATRQQREEKVIAQQAEEQAANQRLRERVKEYEGRLETSERDSQAALEGLKSRYEEKIAFLERDREQQTRLYEREFERGQTMIADVSRQKLPSRSAESESIFDSPVSSPSTKLDVLPSRKPFFWWGAGVICVITIGVSLFWTGNLAKVVSPIPVSVPAKRGATAPEAATAPVESSNSALGWDARESGTTSVSGRFGVLLARGRNLTAENVGDTSAAYEVQRAIRFRVQRTAIYRRSGSTFPYNVVALFDTSEEAESSLLNIRELDGGRWSGTSAVDMTQWCPVTTSPDSIIVTGVAVPVLSCIKLESTTKHKSM